MNEDSRSIMAQVEDMTGLGGAESIINFGKSMKRRFWKSSPPALSTAPVSTFCIAVIDTSIVHCMNSGEMRSIDVPKICVHPAWR